MHGALGTPFLAASLDNGITLFLDHWQEAPFDVIALGIFVCAIIHTFLAGVIVKWSHRVAEKHQARALLARGPLLQEGEVEDVSFSAEILYFLGEVETIFGIWALPLFVLMVCFYDWDTAINYYSTRNYIEPLFIGVIMALSATRPILTLAESALRCVAKIGRGSIGAWWLVILSIGPCLGSFITEPAAMTLSALLLSQQFYCYRPSRRLAYATLGLLFVNISVGGVFTNFAAPPVLMVASKWGWSTQFMLQTFAWRAFTGIIAANALYYFLFRKEFRLMQQERDASGAKEVSQLPSRPIPLWVTGTHLAVLAWTVLNAHNPVIFIGSFILFLGFYKATRPHQHEIDLKGPILVGFFFAGLIIHGGFQGWWLEPLLGNLSQQAMLGVATVLTAFNDNAAITYMTTLLPNFGEGLKYAVVAGAISGGGLTVIANAPNPAGQQILAKHFGNRISPLYLFFSALVPTIIMVVVFGFCT